MAQLLDWDHISITLTHHQIQKLLRQLGQSFYLDSGQDEQKGNWDILSGAPLALLPNEHIEQKKQDIPSQYLALPFVCGELGYRSYNWGADKQFPGKAIGTTYPLTDYFRAYYTWSYTFDRKCNKGQLTFSPLCKHDLRDEVLSIVGHKNKSEIFRSLAEESEPSSIYKKVQSTEIINGKAINWKCSQTFKEYQEQFDQVEHYIHAGDCYQINLTQRFESKTDEEAVDLYFRLRQKVNTPYSVYLELNESNHLLSFSPEQFIGIKDRIISSRPIKGTLPVSSSDLPEALYNSEKNRAENVMIVDLLRNDLSKVSKPHSVKVTELFKLEEYKNVHHLVSTIQGILNDEVSELEAFVSCFPGGSITGAPKIRAIEIIDELEKHSRDAYCGSVYYLNDNGNFDSNILIRTIMKRGNTLHCWGGGGIVADSSVREEYEESLTKVKNLFDHLEVAK